MNEIVIPSVGIAMEEAILLRWLKQPGDPVKAGDVVAEIETDKTTVELDSPAAGTMGPHLVAEGDSVPVGEPVARVYAEGEEQAPATPAATAEPAQAAAAPVVPQTPAAQATREDRGAVRLSPRARRLAAEAASTSTPAAPDSVSRFRKVIAERVSASWREIPHFAVTREVDAEALLVELAAARTTAAHTTLTDLLLVALARALSQSGTVDAADLGLAVATDNGVVIVAIRSAMSADLAAITGERQAAVARACGGQLLPEDLAPAATCTLSNLGALGVDSFTGIIATGQRSLLTVGAVALRPAVVDGQLTVRQRFTATLNVDHRHIDGADAARTLGAFVTAVEGGFSA